MGRGLLVATRRQVLAGLCALPILPMAGRGVAAGSGEARGEEMVRGFAREIWAMLERARDHETRVDQLARLLESRTDVDLLSRLVLGRHWRALEDGQRTGYQALFREVVMRNLALRLDRYAEDASGSLEERFQITGSSPVGKGDVLVRSNIRPQGGEPVDVDWRLRERGDELVIIDLIVAGVSLLVSQRSEFAAVVERAGMDGLLAELRARAESTKAESARS